MSMRERVRERERGGGLDVIDTSIKNKNRKENGTGTIKKILSEE